MVIYQNDVQGFINTATNVQSSLAVLEGATFNWERSWSDTRLSTSYDYADPRLKPTNARVSRVARNMVRAQVNHRVGPWTPFAELRLSGDRFDSASNLTLPGYGVFNLGSSYRWDKNWRIVGRLNNLGDKTYSLANGFTTPGRNLFVSLQWTD
jgi:vitamin B12 transporter